MLLAISLLLSSTSRSGGGGSSTAYLETSRQAVSVPTPSNYTPCDQTYQRTWYFDLEAINDVANDHYVDLAIGFSSIYGIGGVNYIGFENYNNQSGAFPTQNGNFFSDFTNCDDNNRINNFVFGKLRTSVNWNDLAVLRDGGTYIYLNTGNGMSTNTSQTPLSGKATDGT